MGDKVDLDKLRSIGNLRSGYKRTTRDKPHRDNQGRLDGGKEVEHWDGSQDAHIKAKVVTNRREKE